MKFCSARRCFVGQVSSKQWNAAKCSCAQSWWCSGGISGLAQPLLCKCCCRRVRCSRFDDNSTLFTASSARFILSLKPTGPFFEMLHRHVEKRFAAVGLPLAPLVPELFLGPASGFNRHTRSYYTLGFLSLATNVLFSCCLHLLVVSRSRSRRMWHCSLVSWLRLARACPLRFWRWSWHFPGELCAVWFIFVEKSTHIRADFVPRLQSWLTSRALLRNASQKTPRCEEVADTINKLQTRWLVANSTLAVGLGN